MSSNPKIITISILLFLGFFSIHITGVAAAEGEKEGSKIPTDTTSTEETRNISKLRKDIDESIIDFIVVPKARQLIKDIGIKFTEEYPNPEDRIIAYETIRKRLILRKNRIELLKMSDKGKFILQEFLDQMIELLEKRIEELR